MFRTIITRLLHADAAFRQNQRLDRLTDWELQDIGMTREEARLESTRSIWETPGTFARPMANQTVASLPRPHMGY